MALVRTSFFAAASGAPIESRPVGSAAAGGAAGGRGGGGRTGGCVAEAGPAARVGSRAPAAMMDEMRADVPHADVARSLHGGWKATTWRRLRATTTTTTTTTTSSPVP